jgi:hypothetical protein
MWFQRNKSKIAEIKYEIYSDKPPRAVVSWSKGSAIRPILNVLHAIATKQIMAMTGEAIATFGRDSGDTKTAEEIINTFVEEDKKNPILQVRSESYTRTPLVPPEAVLPLFRQKLTGDNK